MGNSWPQLSSLELGIQYFYSDCNKIGDKGLETLMLNLHNIKIVQVGIQINNLANNGITSIGIDKALLAHEIKQLPFLQKLNISNILTDCTGENKLGAAGIKLLVKCNLTRLRDLEISSPFAIQISAKLGTKARRSLRKAFGMTWPTCTSVSNLLFRRKWNWSGWTFICLSPHWPSNEVSFRWLTA